MDQEYSCSAESGVQGTGHQGNLVCCFPAEISVGEGGVEEPLVTLGELCHQRFRTPSLSCLCAVACGSQMPSKDVMKD